MRIGHCQLDSRCGDFEGNLAKVVQGLERADRDRVEIVSFPECFLTGYPDTEELARQGAFATSAPQMPIILSLSSLAAGCHWWLTAARALRTNTSVTPRLSL